MIWVYGMPTYPLKHVNALPGVYVFMRAIMIRSVAICATSSHGDWAKFGCVPPGLHICIQAMYNPLQSLPWIRDDQFGRILVLAY